MKKLAVFGSDFGSNFEAIVEYFKDKEVEITCVSDNKDSYILQSADMLGIKHDFVPFKRNIDFIKEKSFDLIALDGYKHILPSEIIDNIAVINSHTSLLPAFKGNNANIQAYEAGVKVSGVTIYYVTKDSFEGKIIAQYPVFLEEDMNLNDFTIALQYVEQKIYPPAIESILFDKYIDIQSVMTAKSGGCGGGCGGCGH